MGEGGERSRGGEGKRQIRRVELCSLTLSARRVATLPSPYAQVSDTVEGIKSHIGGRRRISALSPFIHSFGLVRTRVAPIDHAHWLLTEAFVSCCFNPLLLSLFVCRVSLPHADARRPHHAGRANCGRGHLRGPSTENADGAGRIRWPAGWLWLADGCCLSAM